MTPLSWQSRRRALVIGGGVGGSTAALALSHIGLTVELVEAMPRSADHKGWVTLGPGAMTALDQVGVGERVRAVGFPIFSVHTVDTQTGAERDFSRVEPTHRWPSTHVWRRDLLAALRERLDDVGVRCRYGAKVSDGHIEADIVVDADGAASETRLSIGNTLQPQRTGEVICYGHHPTALADMKTNVLCFWAHEGGVVGYVGDDRDGSFWFSRAKCELPSLGDMLAPVHRTPVASILDGSSISDPVTLYDLSPEGPWSKDSTVLIGDAVHALSPNSGRGAATAIEDGVILARCVRRAESVSDAFDAFTRLRRAYVQAIYRPVAGRIPPSTTADELNLD